MPYDATEAQREKIVSALRALKNLRARLGRDPTAAEIDSDRHTTSVSWYQRRWGTIRKAVDAAMQHKPETTRLNSSSTTHTSRGTHA